MVNEKDACLASRQPSLCLRYLATACAAVFLLFPFGSYGRSGIGGAELHVVSRSPRYNGAASDAAAAFLWEKTPLLRLETVSLEHGRTLPAGRFDTARFTQMHDGLPVIGTGAAVRVAPDGRVTVLSMRVARNLSIMTTPSVSEKEARSQVLMWMGIGARAGVRASLVVLPLDLDSGSAFLVWQVDVPTAQGGLRFLVDAHDKSLRGMRPLAVHALGRVYPVSSVVTPTLEDLTLAGLDPSSPQHLTGFAGGLLVANYVSGSGFEETLVAEQSLEPNSGEDFLYDPPADPLDATDAFSQVSLYFHMARSRLFYETSFGLDMTNSSWNLMGVANAMENGQPYDNAFYSQYGMGDPWNVPNLIVVYQGTQFDFSQDSDVFLHEFFHYISQNTVAFNMGQMAVNSYGMTPFSASLDEGLADYFACTQNQDPHLGEASLELLGSGRDLGDTSKVCPDDIWAEVHDDGEIIGSLNWTLRESLGADLADDLIWGSMLLLQPLATFGDYGRNLIATANDMVATGDLTAQDATQIGIFIEERGLHECDQEIPIRVGEPRSSTLLGLDIIGMMMGYTCQEIRQNDITLHGLFQFRAMPSSGDLGIRFVVELSPMGGNDLDWSLYVRASEHVLFSSGGGFIPRPSTFDHSVTGITSATGEIVIDGSSDPPFDPSQPYFLSIVSANCPLAATTITVEPVVPVQPDAGVDAFVQADSGQPDAAPSLDASGFTGDQPKSGCTCEAAGRARGTGIPVGLGVLVLLAAASTMLRRRSTGRKR